MHRLTSTLVHRFVYLLSSTAMPVLFSMRIEGGAHIPTSGPALLIANHQSFLDPVLLGLCTSRPLCYLARRTLFRRRFFAWLIRVLRAVPIDHEGVGKEGIRTILEQLQQGEAVVVFPEGERTHDGRMQPLKPGILLLLRKTQAPIVPVGLAGAYAAWPRARKFPVPAPLFPPQGEGTVAVSIGRPLDAAHYAALPRDEALGALSAELQKVQGRAERLRARR
ncbi:MAG: 1-acyl-sn-glycerol-3-phosphate acyltransferase [Gemmataceae bacterium]|nr:1-acyl-sn-glycerol-3-phosphate acyltransferase [Gemmataceae bacterium]